MSSDPEEAAREPIPVADVAEDSSPLENANDDGEREVIESDEDTSKDEPEAKPKKRGASQRIGELVSLNKAKDAELERVYRLLEQGKTPQQAAGKQSDDSEPKRDAYDDYEAFLEDRARWVARQEFREQTNKHEAATRKEREARAFAEVSKKWEQSHEAAIDAHDDYEEIFEVVGTSINAEQASAVREADDPAEVVYYFGKNPKEFAKFKGLSGAAAARAVGRIEERLSVQREQRSKAPAPVRPVKGSQPSLNQLSDDMPIDKWMALRNKQVRG